MSVVVICEFNPFHNGHKYLIDKAKDYGDVICIMSGAFTQRGEPAITDKYARAKQAVIGGADAVIELPTVFATSSAQFFASGAAEIIKNIGGVTHIIFGAETDDVQTLSVVAKQKNEKSTVQRTKEIMKTGVSYANAICSAVGEINDKYTQVLSTPNNLLAVEYIAALAGSGIEPVAVKRTVSHDGTQPVDKFASASLVRKLIERGSKDARLYMSEEMLRACGSPPDLKLYENLILYSLLNKSKDELENLRDVENGLGYLLYKSVRECTSVSKLIEKLKSKRYTYARLRRILLSSLLDINKHIMSDITRVKTRILAIKKGFKPHLCDFNPDNIITRNSMLTDDFVDNIVKIDMLANDIYALLCGKQFNDYLAKPMLII